MSFRILDGLPPRFRDGSRRRRRTFGRFLVCALTLAFPISPQAEEDDSSRVDCPCIRVSVQSGSGSEADRVVVYDPLGRREVLADMRRKVFDAAFDLYGYRCRVRLGQQKLDALADGPLFTPCRASLQVRATSRHDGESPYGAEVHAEIPLEPTGQEGEMELTGRAVVQLGPFEHPKLDRDCSAGEPHLAAGNGPAEITARLTGGQRKNDLRLLLEVPTLWVYLPLKCPGLSIEVPMWPVLNWTLLDSLNGDTGAGKAVFLSQHGLWEHRVEGWSLGPGESWGTAAETALIEAESGTVREDVHYSLRRH